MTIRTAVIGHGRMGQWVEALAPDRGVDIVDVLGREAMRSGASALESVDVAIEFTVPDAAVDNIRVCLQAGCPVVVGTSGWYDRLPEVRDLVESEGGTVLWAENFSPGYVITRALAKRMAVLAGGNEGYDMHLVEWHHAAKLDAPSGTARRLHDEVAGAFPRPVGVTSVRTGQIPGTHELTVDGTFDRVVLRHEVRDRRVFADGALLAARWLHGREPGLYSIDDLAEEVGGR